MMWHSNSNHIPSLQRRNKHENKELDHICTMSQNVFLWVFSRWSENYLPVTLTTHLIIYNFNYSESAFLTKLCLFGLRQACWQELELSQSYADCQQFVEKANRASLHYFGSTTRCTIFYYRLILKPEGVISDLQTRRVG